MTAESICLMALLLLGWLLQICVFQKKKKEKKKRGGGIKEKEREDVVKRKLEFIQVE